MAVGGVYGWGGTTLVALRVTVDGVMSVQALSAQQQRKPMDTLRPSGGRESCIVPPVGGVEGMLLHTSLQPLGGLIKVVA